MTKREATKQAVEESYVSCNLRPGAWVFCYYWPSPHRGQSAWVVSDAMSFAKARSAMATWRRNRVQALIGDPI